MPASIGVPSSVENTRSRSSHDAHGAGVARAGAYKDLRARSDEEVERLYDEAMGHTTSSLGPYRDELVRRESARVASESAKAAHELVELTRTIRVLTIVLAVTGIVAIVVALASR